MTSESIDLFNKFMSHLFPLLTWVMVYFFLRKTEYDTKIAEKEQTRLTLDIASFKKELVDCKETHIKTLENIQEENLESNKNPGLTQEKKEELAGNVMKYFPISKEHNLTKEEYEYVMEIFESKTNIKVDREKAEEILGW